jgi:hypothetical protein
VGDPEDISSWRLPIDSDHIESALKMFGHEQHVPDSEKSKVARKIASAAKSAGLDTKDFEDKYCSQTHAESPRLWMEIFRAGDYSKAGKGVITPEDLRRVARNYDPTYHEAPITIGHPEDNKPAYGWIDGLMVDGDTLLAREKQVDPKFDEARQAGKFKKRSAAFYTDDAGKITGLRHLAWLGACPPEVKGLQDVAFDDHGSKFIMVDFGEDGTVAEKTVAEQIKAFFVETFGGSSQPASKTFSEADVTRIATETATAAAVPLQAKIAALETEVKTSTAKFGEREAALATAEVEQRAVDAINNLKSKGAWVPAFDKTGLPLVFRELAKATATVEFGEGDAKKKVTPLQGLVLFMEGLGRIVPPGRVVGSVPTAAGGRSTGDPLTDASIARQKEKGITFGEALRQVSEEHPEWTGAGQSTGGQV